MDWQKITDAVTTAQTLESADYEAYLAELTQDSPKIAAEVKRLIERARMVDAFMMTSIGDALPQMDPALNIEDTVGVWKITDVLGAGGMGNVYLAIRNDGLYNQTVALKVMRGANDTRKSHFQQERQRLAQLNHPNIATILDGGATADGNPYMAMEFVDGDPIADYVRNKDLNTPQRLSLFKHVCRAISHAHANLVLHRDIKSDNILVDTNGRVSLIDFGIATLLGDEADATSGPFTLAMAAPEQLNGERVSVQTDIFALGVLLHQLVTDKLPSRMPDGSMILVSERLKDKDINAIIAKAMATNPQDRYASADKLEDEIDAVLSRRPVEARNGDGLYKVIKFIRRAPVATTLGAAFIAALVVGMGATTYYADEARAEAVRANAEAKRANEELTRAEWSQKEAELHAEIGTAYGDAFQYAFGQNEDIELLSNRLQDYQKLAIEEDREDNAEAAAVKTYVIGRHFIERNDYVAARKILEPWINEGYGSKQILSFGQSNLGYAYRNLGENELAGNMFRKAEEFYMGTPSENSINHAAMAVQAALFSDDIAPTEKAKRIVEVYLKTDDAAFSRMYFMVQIYEIESKQARWDEAYQALSKSVAIIDEGEISRSAGMDTVRLNLARLEVFLKRDFAAANTQIGKAQEIADTKKGESKEQGRIFELQAVMAHSNGDIEAAIDNISRALPIFEKYAGTSTNYIYGVAQKGIFLTDAQNYEAAEDILGELSSDLNNKSGLWDELLQLYIAARRDGIEAAQTLYDTDGLKIEDMPRNIRQIYYLKILEADGLKL